MSDSRNCVITATHFDRPDYTRRHLEALARCAGIGDCLYLPHAEPKNEEVVALLRAASFCETRVTVNPCRVHADPNTVMALDEAFALSDFAIHVEDDILLAPDALDFFWWCRARYAGDPAVLSVAGYTRGPEPPPEDHHKVTKRAWFHPWGVGLWRDRWERCRPAVLRVSGTDPATLRLNGQGVLGWDGALNKCRERWGLFEVYPTLSRVQNVGSVSSIHGSSWFTPDWHAQNQHSPHWAGDGREVSPGAWEGAETW